MPTPRIMPRSFLTAGLLLPMLLLSAGCTPVGVLMGAGASAGIAGAQERTIGTAVDDAVIQTKISDLWFRHSEKMFEALDMTVIEGRVLITGQLDDPDLRVDAVRLAWQVDGVREVINEIQLTEGEGLQGYARDVRIANELRAKLTFDRQVSAINYSIDTVGGVVYLMGIAKNQAELDRVIAQARNIDSVRRVVSYVRLLSEAPAGGDNDNTAPAAPAAATPATTAPADNSVTADPLPLNRSN